jgi:hypothetical protein
LAIITTGAGDLTVTAHRNQTSLLLIPGLSPLSSVDGVHNGLGIVKTSGMNFTIGVGRAALNHSSADEGAYVITVQDPEPGSFANGDANYDRIDLVTLQVNPTATSEEATNIVVVKGVASSVPDAPNYPAGALVLYEVKIKAGTTSANGGWSTANATDVRPSIGITRWNSFTPQWGGFGAQGAGFHTTGRWKRDGDMITVQAQIIFGSSPSWGNGQPYMNLPVSRESDGYRGFGRGIYIDRSAGSTYYDMQCIATIDRMQIYGTAGSKGSFQWPGGMGLPLGKDDALDVFIEYSVNPKEIG